MIDKYNFKVSVPLTPGGLSLVAQQVEVISEWVDELVSWDRNKRFMNYVDSHPRPRLDIWFEEEHHAMWCSLRWS